MANDLRVFAQAYESFATQNAGWPPNVGPGIIPPAVRVGWLKNGVWLAKTPVGGQWNWDYEVAGLGFRAGVSISNFTWPVAQLREIDALIDDGDLPTGSFRRPGGGRVSFVLEL